MRQKRLSLLSGNIQVPLGLLRRCIGIFGYVIDVCRCEHERAAHTHYRAGSECVLCAPGHCSRFRSARPIRGLMARLGLRRNVGDSAAPDVPARPVAPTSTSTVAR
jgi:hypothetical protein